LIDLVEAVEDPVPLVRFDPLPSIAYSYDDAIGVDADDDRDPLVSGEYFRALSMRLRRMR
jgi:hypothetical protein